MNKVGEFMITRFIPGLCTSAFGLITLVPNVMMCDNGSKKKYKGCKSRYNSI